MGHETALNLESQWDQEVSAYVTVVGSLVRAAKTEATNKAKLNTLFDTVDSLLTLARHLNHSLSRIENSLTDDQRFHLSVETDLGISNFYQNFSASGATLLQEVEQWQPPQPELIKKLKAVEVAYKDLFTRTKALGTSDEWDRQMHDDAENGCFDHLIHEANKEYAQGNLRFN